MELENELKQFKELKVSSIKIEIVLQYYKKWAEQDKHSQKDLGQNVKETIENRELLNAMKIRDENNDAILQFDLDNPDITSLVLGTCALTLPEKEHVMTQVSNLIRNKMKQKQTEDSENITSKLSLINSLNSFSSKTEICDQLLLEIQQHQKKLKKVEESRDKVENKHFELLEKKANNISFTTEKMINNLGRDIVTENQDIITAMDELKASLDTELILVTIKLKELDNLLKEYEELDQDVFDSILNNYRTAKKAIGQIDQFLKMFD